MRNANIRRTRDCFTILLSPLFTLQSKIPKHWPVIFIMKPSNYHSGFSVRQRVLSKFSSTDRQRDRTFLPSTCWSETWKAIIKIINNMKRHEDDLQLISMQNNPFGISGGAASHNLEGNGYGYTFTEILSFPFQVATLELLQSVTTTTTTRGAITRNILIN